MGLREKAQLFRGDDSQHLKPSTSCSVDGNGKARQNWYYGVS
jgi:hypothetical protein